MIFYQSDRATLHCGDALTELRLMADNSVNCIITSAPYWALRSYLPAGSPDKEKEIGLESSFEEYLARLVEVFEQCRRVLHKSGVMFINHGDSYCCAPNGRSAVATKAAGGDDRTFRDKPDVRASYRGDRASVALASRPGGFKEKDRIGQPHRLVFALQDAGWYFRDEIIWSKRSAMPSSVTDRTTCQHEFVFMLTKSPRYFYDQFSIRERCTAESVARMAKPWNGNHERQSTQNPQTLAMGPGFGSGEWRNKRSVWDVNTQAAGVEHYASYPLALVQPMVMAGSSERGVCSKCGEPWVRIVKKSGGTTGKDWHDDRENDGEQGQRYHGQLGAATNGDGSYRVESLGWRAGCKCGAPTRPATILDPFCGTSTTLAVALSLGRHAVGIELSEKYCKISKRRLQSVTVPIPGLGSDTEIPEPEREVEQSLVANLFLEE